ncbi:hypothetical protein [Rodentibacter caecimuris]|uniref:hypothetical protein n=1 Tax=Rodentibacter caecimuris TaxID=1796644 RepID=UPI0009858BBB|nr:hypothetical protein BKG97_01915 [Rodentibacter heylii]
MLTEEIKQAILKGAAGITRDGQRAIYIGKDKDKEVKMFPYVFVVFDPTDLTTADTWWYQKDFTLWVDRDAPQDIVGLWKEHKTYGK